MSTVVITTPTRDEGMIRTGQSAGVRGVARIAQPLKVGQTLYRTNGVWTMTTTPRHDVLEAADLVYRGGYVYTIERSIYDEIVAAGFALVVHVGGYVDTYTDTY